ncbi:MAG: hypothetical protein IJX14_00115, partial [Clostridia bacterium]|nr:hypothetical protein [Clostridia bacterium]
METREMEHITPMVVSLSWNGSMKSTDVFHFTEGHLVQQILAAAYDKPLTDGEIAEKIGIPVYYIEDLLENAVQLEIMVKTESGRYYTDACMTRPEDWIEGWNGCCKMVEEHLDAFSACLQRTEASVENLTWYGELSHRKQWKLKRFVFLETVQRAKHASMAAERLERPKRKDGGSWTLVGTICPMGYVTPVRVHNFGGHRTTDGHSVNVMLHEFDTTIWDNPFRCEKIDWITHMADLLYAVHTGQNPLERNVPAEMIEAMDSFTESGLFALQNGERIV